MMKKPCLSITLLLCFLSISSSLSQTADKVLQKNIKDYLSLTREVVYLQLNKTLLLQGEQLGFSAYVLNKKDLKPSLYTTNLYVQIKNSVNEVVREELLLVENGIATGIIDVDSTFITDEYTITAFTNWMQNFKEANHFSEKIRVLEFNTSTAKNQNERQPAIDAGFLPESGHLLKDVKNNIGVVVKDSLGKGLSNARVIIKDSGGKLKDTVNLNRFGIGRFSLIPKESEAYKAVVFHNGEEFPLDVEMPLEKKGVTISTGQEDSILRINIATNKETLPSLQVKPYFLTVSGRGNVESVPVLFREQEYVAFSFDMNKLDPGVNTITLFDFKHRPVAERLIFNHIGLPLSGRIRTNLMKSSDSLGLRFSFDGDKDRNVSVSVLPQNTVSHHRDHDIVSHYMLRSFVRGTIESGSWYFSGKKSDKIDDLDNLLLTQGWSSYDWQSIFQKDRPFAFEKHFELKVNLKDKNKHGQRYMVHASSRNPLQVLEIPAANEHFVFEGFLPVEGEKLNISRLKQNDQLEPAKLSVDFTPNKIPQFRPFYDAILPVPANSALITRRIFAAYDDEFTLGAEGLEEVLISANVDRVKERERKLAQNSYGSVSVITEEDLLLFGTLGNFLNTKNLSVVEEDGSFSVTSSFAAMSTHNSQADPDNPKPVFDDPFAGIAIYLDENLLSDLSILHRYPLQYVDYVEINKSGIGNGFVGSKGSIKIYSKATKFLNPRERSSMTQLDYPLAYSAKKVFYTPKYENTRDGFFEEYGVIDWIPNLLSNNGEDISFFIKKPEVDFQLIVEGITTDGQLIYEVQNFPADD